MAVVASWPPRSSESVWPAGRLLSRYRSRADWTGLDGIGRDWTGLDGIGQDSHWPVAALGGGVTYHPHRSEDPNIAHLWRAVKRAGYERRKRQESLTGDHDNAARERIDSDRPGSEEAVAKIHARLAGAKCIPAGPPASCRRAQSSGAPAVRRRHYIGGSGGTAGP